ncbi:hypothetical protein K435DRAFT_350877 [Dendrothele bispora CBS 962.96]|uniref:Uncharacterized protein n=1 Tax=Dendrothele bispora (strain CBS 962.96) TaxID=1314807 RepID=A0A4S8MJI6_DENBC|nr:hypothetical protein K435DRAFT_350877 [Dendrothele bispora CBS 962.96]
MKRPSPLEVLEEGALSVVMLSSTIQLEFLVQNHVNKTDPLPQLLMMMKLPHRLQMTVTVHHPRTDLSSEKVWHSPRTNSVLCLVLLPKSIHTSLLCLGPQDRERGHFYLAKQCKEPKHKRNTKRERKRKPTLIMRPTQDVSGSKTTNPPRLSPLRTRRHHLHRELHLL